MTLLLGPDGEELRTLVIKEAARVTEAVVLSSMVDTYNSIPNVMKALILNFSIVGPPRLSDTEMESMIDLRDQVFRVWGLLRSSRDFDPSLLQPVVQVRTSLSY